MEKITLDYQELLYILYIHLATANFWDQENHWRSIRPTTNQETPHF